MLGLIFGTLAILVGVGLILLGLITLILTVIWDVFGLIIRCLFDIKVPLIWVAIFALIFGR